MKSFSPLLALLCLAPAAAQESGRLSEVAEALVFHASFDDSTDADMAGGDKRIHTAASLQRTESQPGLKLEGVRRVADGRFGHALHFSRKTTEVVYYRGAGNLPPVREGFQGTISFWMRLSPDDDLPPGYVDPLQITDKKWNDASFFVDFTEAPPRQFRLGVFSDYAVWNPDDRPWEAIPDAERPLVAATEPPFAADRWTHVAITFAGFNRDGEEAEAALYLDGKSHGTLRRVQHFTWEPEKVAIMLGIAYVGGIDDFAIFDRALTAAEIDAVRRLPNGMRSLRSAP